MDLHPDLLGVAAMPWLLFGVGTALFGWLGRRLRLPRPTTGAVIMLGGLGSTSLIGLPVIESCHGTAPCRPGS
ncbi:hypothetical protein [Dankookia rubra]|uniref:hypothetical protein n=1 Tax=Dankookia rubra TaxID=1442381 RepID=UPI0019D521B9|nr:hypothetical protein [Dankookia rubra]